MSGLFLFPIFNIALYSEIRDMFKVTLFFSILLIFAACATKEKPTTLKTGTVIRYAKTLNITEHGTHTEINIVHPEHKTVQSFILSKEKPEQLNAGQTWIKIPVTSMITLSGTHIGMLSVLNELKRIKGVSNQKYIYNKSIIKRVQSGEIFDFGVEESIPVESIVASKAELLIFSGFGKDFPHTDQLKRAGTICLPNYDWKEIHPLGKAEWILFFGYLTGTEKKAKDYFKHIEKEYLQLKAKASKAKKDANVFSGNLYGDIWFTPAGESYNALMISDAGGNYRYKDTKGTGSLELSLEKVFSDNMNTQFWLNPGIATLTDLKMSNPKAIHFKAYKEHTVFCYSPNINYFWEMSAIEPHKVLADLITIFHPELGTGKLNFYERIK